MKTQRKLDENSEKICRKLAENSPNESFRSDPSGTTRDARRISGEFENPAGYDLHVLSQMSTKIWIHRI